MMPCSAAGSADLAAAGRTEVVAALQTSAAKISERLIRRDLVRWRTKPCGGIPGKNGARTPNGMNERAMEMIADRVLKTRRETWEAKDDDGNTLNRCYGIAHLGGATLDNEENYLIKKLYTALGVVQVENQARL